MKYRIGGLTVAHDIGQVAFLRLSDLYMSLDVNVMIIRQDSKCLLGKVSLLALQKSAASLR